MPIREKEFKSQLTDEVGNFIDNMRKKDPDSESDPDSGSFMSIIEFIDKFNLLPDGLYPVQRFIVKLYYNIPLDDKNKTITVKNRHQEFVCDFTEVEYLQYLYDQGRCNIGVQDSKRRTELILVLGRRSGKSQLSSIFASYEIYKLIKRGNPQSYYGMPGTSEIRIMCVANDKDQAGIVFDSIRGFTESVDYFKSSLCNTTQTFMRFRTDNDKKIFRGSKKGTITATFKSSIAKGLRGRGVICGILDEIAFFVDNGKSSAEKVYKSLNPSIAQFSRKNKKTRESIGNTEGRMILISSPDAKDGFFYKQYLNSMSGHKSASNTLCIRAPTWEVNPTLSKEYYEIEFSKDPKAFMTEFGAEFSDRVRGFIEDEEDLVSCVQPTLRPATRGLPRDPHFAGLDVGLVNDGTSIFLTHINNGFIELAYHEYWLAGYSWKELNPHLTSPPVPYCFKLKDVSRIDFHEIVNWIKVLSNKFHIHHGVFDQWSGVIFEQAMHHKGLTQFEMRNFTTSDSSKAFQNFKMTLLGDKIRLYDYPAIVTNSGNEQVIKHCPYIEELLDLQMTSAGKNMISVEAPRVQGKHDDMSDALVRSVLSASEYIQKNPGVLDKKIISSIGSKNNFGMTYHQYHNMRNRLHGKNKDRPNVKITRRFLFGEFMDFDLTESVGYKIVNQIIDHIYGHDTEFNIDMYNDIYRYFNERGGSWVSIIEGDPEHFSILEDVINGVIDFGSNVYDDQ